MPTIGSVATCVGADGPYIESRRWEQDFACCADRARSPPNLLRNRYRGLSWV
jgi:hypothetical protein